LLFHRFELFINATEVTSLARSALAGEYVFSVGNVCSQSIGIEQKSVNQVCNQLGMKPGNL